MGHRARGRQLAEALVCDDAKVAADARAQLGAVYPKATDAAAKRLVQMLRGSEAEARAVCRALTGKKPPRFGPVSHARLTVALLRVSERGRGELRKLAHQAMLDVSMHGRDGKYFRKLQDGKPPGNPHPVARVASVAKQPWVIVVYGLASLLLVPMALAGDAASTYGVVGLVGLAVLFVVIDTFKRRCPKCRRLLAADLLTIVRSGSYENTQAVQTTSGGTGYVSSTVSTHAKTWRCVHCRHKWTT